MLFLKDESNENDDRVELDSSSLAQEVTENHVVQIGNRIRQDQSNNFQEINDNENAAVNEEVNIGQNGADLDTSIHLPCRSERNHSLLESDSELIDDAAANEEESGDDDVLIAPPRFSEFGSNTINLNLSNSESLNADATCSSSSEGEEMPTDADSRNAKEKHIQDDTELRQPLYQGGKITLGHALVLMVSFAIGCQLSKSAIGSLLDLLHFLLPTDNLLPPSKYFFFKYFDKYTSDIQNHFYCPGCMGYLGKEDTDLHCGVCEMNYDSKELYSKGHFFIHLGVKKQLKEILSNPNLAKTLDYSRTRIKDNEDGIEDIYDGKEYMKRIGTDERNLSITYNTDGVPIFKSSNYSIWPIQGILNELPSKLRSNNVMLFSLWFGTSKPVMTTFLKPFVDELIQLSITGIEWARHQRIVWSKVYACICSCDSVARCMLQNIKQFNGKYGCSWCLNEGVVVAKGRGHCRVYPPANNINRTNESIVRNAHLAFNSAQSVKGVKGPSPLMRLPSFNMVSGFVVDNLHCVDLGVARQMAHLWFDKLHKHAEWFIGDKMDLINSRLALIKPCDEITRTPRSLHERVHWKGSEWHWWLLFYAPVILQDILPTRYLDHLLLLSDSVFLLSQSSISQSQVNSAKANLNRFVSDFQLLYGLEHVTYNVHQLSHMPDTVVNWGPLSNYSSYIFEGFNMVLLKLYHGTQAIPQQISSSFLLYKGAKNLMNTVNDYEMSDLSYTINRFVNEQLYGHKLMKKSISVQESITFLGTFVVRKFAENEIRLVEDFYSTISASILAFDRLEIRFYSKAIINGNVLHSAHYNRKSRRQNCIVKLSDNTIVKIIDLFAIFTSQTVVFSAAFARIVNYRPYFRSDKCDYISKFTDFSDELICISLDDIIGKILTINEQNRVIGLLPNLTDRD